MSQSAHTFHIPVMGTGFTIDTPIRVAHLGIDSVISIVDDLLVERIRKAYAARFGLPFSGIPRNEPDGRAKRIAAYLDLVQDIVTLKFAGTQADPTRYAALLPGSAGARPPKPGSIDVNIMSKVDRLESGNDLSDAVAALAGFVRSKVEGAVVLSAGFNPRLYNALAAFPEFYRDATGSLRKRIILKVSDFRSAMIQGRYLAKKGLEVSEFRVESGLNCGGHAFYSDGKLLPVILEEFRDMMTGLRVELRELVRGWYVSAGKPYQPDATPTFEVTAQGGIGTRGEADRLRETYGISRTGWGSPFLLVPEATCVDDPTLRRLVEAGEDDLYLSKASPLGVPFNNLRGSGSEQWHAEREAKGKPGSPCPKGFLKSNTEFTEEAICTASSEYMGLKLAQIDASDAPEPIKQRRRADVLAKQCLCDHLGNSSLIALGIVKESQGPQAICPGPNLAYFAGPYTLEQMVDHIYGRGDRLTPADRPHMFAKELKLNVDYLETLVRDLDPADTKQTAYLDKVVANLLEGIATCRALATETPFADENLASLAAAADREEDRIRSLSKIRPVSDNLCPA